MKLKGHKMKIFIQMVGYRTNIVETMRNCISNSANKDNLFFGICLQQEDNIPEELNHERIKVHKVNWNESRGPGWALRQAQQFYQGQEYTMLVDSNVKFEKDWDKTLIEALESTNSQKPIITNVPPKNDPNVPKERSISYRPIVYQLIQNPLIWPIPMKGVDQIVPNNWISRLFFFTRGSHCTECPYDPEIYFSEIESNITVRSYTSGYDIFAFHKPIVWQDYSPTKMNWQDDPNWILKDISSKKRLQDLLQGNLKEFNLGSVRSLRDFEIYSGIDLLNKRLNKFESSGSPYKFENETQWENDYQKDYNIVAKWDVNEIEKCDDYDYWYFSIEDKDENTLYRYDIRPDRDQDIFSFKTNFRRLVFKSQWDKVPSKLCIWPVSKSKGWLKKSKFEL